MRNHKSNILRLLAITSGGCVVVGYDALPTINMSTIGLHSQSGLAEANGAVIGTRAHPGGQIFIRGSLDVFGHQLVQDLIQNVDEAEDEAASEEDFVAHSH